MSALLASVIIPVRDGERFLAEAVESAFAQTYPSVEVIVVDDGSQDETAGVARRFPDARYLRQAPSGPAAARNRGVAESSGTYIAYLDSDDTLPADKLEIQIGHLESHPDVGCVLGRQELQVETVGRLPIWVSEESLWVKAAGQDAFIPREAIPPMSMVIRRETFDLVGPFDVGMRLGEDSDWVFRAQEAGVKVEILDRIVLTRRLHGANLTADAEAYRNALFRVVKARIDRKRARAGGTS